MLRDKILKTLEAYHDKTGGHCGITSASLTSQLNVEFKEMKPVLNQLYKDKKITVHPNVHGLLVKIKK